MGTEAIWTRWCAGIAALGLALPLFAASVQAAPSAMPVAPPAVTRAPNEGAPWSAATIDIDAHGYVEEEYFIEGTARSYVPTVNVAETRDGRWDAAPTGPTAPYKVRLLVERPRDPEKFNGMVIVEWFNVSAQMDGGTFSSYDEWFLEQGYAYVGVSAQAAGIKHLNGLNAARYGGLSHPGDSYSYDIFSQAAQALRSGNPGPLGDLTPRVRALVAWGGSQSGGRLITYINAVHPSARMYDGFVPLVTGWSAALTQEPLPVVPAPTGPVLMIRTDVPTPILVQNSEFEALGSARGFHGQPDSPTFRLWEHAGTAHASARTAAALGTRRGAATTGSTPGLTCENPPANGLSLPPVWRAMISGMRGWLFDRLAPQSAPRVELSIPADPEQPAAVVRDPATGIAKGGIRLPQIAVPIASRWGERPKGMDENPSCRLYGTSDPWNGDSDPWDRGPHDISPSPEPSLRVLYGDNAGYVRRVQASAQELVAKSWLLQADADAIVEDVKGVEIK